jgi:hypothetical protein
VEKLGMIVIKVVVQWNPVASAERAGNGGDLMPALCDDTRIAWRWLEVAVRQAPATAAIQRAIMIATTRQSGPDDDGAVPRMGRRS